LGFVIWQDQTFGGSGGSEWPKRKRLPAFSKNYSPTNPNWWQNENDALDVDWPDWAHEKYMDELKTTIDLLYNHPSVVVWTTFNERWANTILWKLVIGFKLMTDQHCLILLVVVTFSR
tara:strand:- start:65007 stop:65360 length:354 start_codon:yes stop_codon:yes gene_type:complete